jgi:hypothetical protein
MASQIEQGALANAIGYPMVLNQTVAIVATAVPGGPCLDSANKHGDTLTTATGCRQCQNIFQYLTEIQQNGAILERSVTKMG